MGGTQLFRNDRRVTKRTVTDTVMGTSGDWTYGYGGAERNSLGANGGDPQPWQLWPNSAALYANKHWSSFDITSHLAIKDDEEFRGHAWVDATAPNGLRTRTFFYQGDVSEGPDGSACVPAIPPASGDNLATYDSDPCFATLRTHEALVGRAYRVEVYDPAVSTVNPVRATRYTYTIGEHDYPQFAESGIWHWWAYASQVQETQTDAGGQYLTGTTKRYYDVTLQSGGTQYGNLTAAEEYDAGGAFTGAPSIRSRRSTRPASPPPAAVTWSTGGRRRA